MNTKTSGTKNRRDTEIGDRENRGDTRTNDSPAKIPGAGIMQADDRQMTTVFTVQPLFHHRHSTNRVLPSSANVQSHFTSLFDDDGNAS